MYTRGPSIASIFQKAILMKDTKCNQIIQRTMCSDSLIKISKIEKLQPIKRCFSGASNSRNLHQRNRNVQGVGYIRKGLPQFPSEMVQQQPLSTNEQMVSPGVACDNLGTSATGDATNTNGTITVVLDKNEICGCSTPNENIQIYVTTSPERMRSVQELSRGDTTEVCRTNCNCCPQCQEVNNFRMFSMRPNIIAFQQQSNTMNFPNHLPVRRQNVNGLAYGYRQSKLRMLNGERPLNLRKSRSMSDFPIMRKFIGLNQPQQNEAPKVNRPTTQQNRRRGMTLERPDRRVDKLEVERRAKRLDWLKKEQRKYSSFDQNVIPENSRFKKPDVQQSKQPNTRQLPSSWNFNVLNGGRLLTLRKNRSMSDFPAMRKLMAPKSFNLMKRHTRQLPLKLNGSPIYHSGSFSKHQPPAFQRTMNPNLQQMRRRFSVLGLPSNNELPRVYSSSVQQPRSSSIVLQRSDQHTRSRPVDIPDRGRYTRTIDEFNEQEPKYNSIYRNFIPGNIPSNQPDAKQNKQPKHEKEMGRSGPGKNQPSNQSRFMVETVIRPASFASVGRALNTSDSIASALKEIAATRKIKSNLTNPRQKKVNSSNAPFIRKPDPFNLQEVIARKKYPHGRSAVPRLLTFQNRNAFNGAQQADNVSKSISRVGLRETFTSSPMRNAGRANVLSKSKLSHQQFSISPKQWSTGSISHGNPLINQRIVNLRQRQMTSKKISDIRPSFHPIRNVQLPRVSYKQRSNTHLYFRRPVQMRANHTNHNGQMKQPPKFLLKKRTVPAMNLHRQKIRQSHGKRRRSFIPIPQRANHQKNVQRPASDFRNTRQSPISMIPVRNRFSQQNPGSLRRMPIQSVNRLFGLNQTKNIPTLGATKPMLNQENQYVQRVKSLEAAGRLNPYRRTTNPRRLQQMQPLRQTAPHMVPDTLKPISFKGPQADAPNSKISNQAVLFYAPGKLKLVDVPMPRLTDDKGVIVKILYVHLTDTDAQMLSSVQDGSYKLTQPTIAGKSGSGVIVDAGKKVENVKIGDKVSVKGLSCGKCTPCQNNNEVMCERVSITKKLGTLKRFHAVPAKFVTKLPDAVHPIDGAMIDELSSAIRACKKSTITAGDNVLVLGGKSLGLWTTLAAKSMGATNVCLADSRPLVLEQGKKLGIENVFLIDPKSPTANTAKSIAEYMQGDNPRIVFDCNGSPLTNEIAINTSMIGGKVVLMKNAISNQPTFLANAVDRGIDILSSQHGNDDSERAALQFLSSGKVQLKGIDSSFFNMTNIYEAFGLLTSGATANVFIQPNGPDDESDGQK